MDKDKKDEYVPKKSNLSDFKVHDCVVVVMEHNNRNESWRDNKYRGVITAIGGDWLEVKQADGTITEISTTEPFLDEKYSLVLSDYSEISFRDDIEKSLKVAERELEEATEKLSEVINWKDSYNNEVSALQKVLRWARNIK